MKDWTVIWQPSCLPYHLDVFVYKKGSWELKLRHALSARGDDLEALQNLVSFFPCISSGLT